MNSYYKYRSIPKSSFYNINILILPINTTEKYLKYFIHFCLCLRPPAIMKLIFRTMRLENFMTSCRDKLQYHHHAISNKIKFNFLIILFGKISSSKSLPSCGTEPEIERMTDFEKCNLEPYTLEPSKSKVPVAYAGADLRFWRGGGE